MKKMEEMMELLTDELAGFDGSVKKLEQLSKNLDTIQLKADSTNIEYLMKEHLKEQKKVTRSFEERLDGLEMSLTKSRILPKWYLWVFATSTLAVILTIGYFGYQGFQLQKAKEEAYQRGQENIINHFSAYFDKEPEAYKVYKEWKTEADDVPSQ